MKPKAKDILQFATKVEDVEKAVLRECAVIASKTTGSQISDVAPHSWKSKIPVTFTGLLMNRSE